MSFVALMALYESNYVRLGWLSGDPGALRGEYVSRRAADCELRLAVRERARYTTTIELTYPGIAMPELSVRVYHDARLAEAQGGESAPERWARNMLLNKWLEYCVERGHRFPG